MVKMLNLFGFQFTLHKRKWIKRQDRWFAKIKVAPFYGRDSLVQKNYREIPLF